MNELLNLVKKQQTAWDFFVPSEDDLKFIQNLEDALLEMGSWE